MPTTPSMLLPVPDDHTDDDTWGLALNAVFGVIDRHDHSTGKGVQVPSAGIGINADLSFATFALTTAKAVTFNPVALSAVTGYASALFVNAANNNLYFRNNSGTNVQITNGGTINMSLIGGVLGDYAAVSASLSYNDSSKDYLLQQEGSPRPWAGLETGDIKLFQKAASIANAVTLKSPNALAASYAVTFPPATPGSQLLLQMDASGNIVASNTLPSGTSITLQGTGKVAHGAYTVPIPAIRELWSVAAGTAVATGGTPGTDLSAGFTGYYPLHGLAGLKTNEPITGFKVDLASAPGVSVTYDIAEMDSTSGGFSPLGVGGSSSSSTPSFTFAARTPLTGDTFWLKVTTPGGGGARVLTVEVTQQG